MSETEEKLYFSSLDTAKNNARTNFIIRFIARVFGTRFRGQDTDLANVRYLEVTRYRKKLYFVKWVERPANFEDKPENLSRSQEKKLKAVESNRIYAKGEKLPE